MHMMGAAGVLFFALQMPAAGQDKPVEAKEGDYSLTIPKSDCQPGESITISFTASADLGSGSWIGILPASVAKGDMAGINSNYKGYGYTQGKTKGTVKLSVPGKAGEWTIRMIGVGKVSGELLCLPFTVKELKSDVKPGLTLPKTNFSSHETFKIGFTVSPVSTRPWIGMVPSSIPHGTGSVNDRHDT